MLKIFKELSCIICWQAYHQLQFTTWITFYCVLMVIFAPFLPCHLMCFTAILVVHSMVLCFDYLLLFMWYAFGFMWYAVLSVWYIAGPPGPQRYCWQADWLPIAPLCDCTLFGPSGAESFGLPICPSSTPCFPPTSIHTEPASLLQYQPVLWLLYCKIKHAPKVEKCRVPSLPGPILCLYHWKQQHAHSFLGRLISTVCGHRAVDLSWGLQASGTPFPSSAGIKRSFVGKGPCVDWD